MKKLYAFFFFYCLSISICAQNGPGGIPNYKLWLFSIDSINSSDSPKQNIFNYHPCLDLSKTKLAYDNFLTDKSSFFIVFQSDIKEEHSILELQQGGKKLTFTNKKIFGDNFSEIPVNSSATGSIVHYLAYKKDLSKKRFHDLSLLPANNTGQDHKIMEVIYYPYLLSQIKKQKVQTYLSLKYGISLAQDENYVNSNSDTIWNAKENKLFTHRITGIGRDDGLSLYQKQSGNSKKDGVYIGLGTVKPTNKKNSSEISNGTFMIWADNNGTTTIKENKNENLLKMDRIWKIRFINPNKDSISTQLLLKKEEINLDETQKTPLLLAISSHFSGKFDYDQAVYIEQSHEDEEFIYFDNIKWKDYESAYFTFVKTPDFYVQYQLNYECYSETGNVKLKVHGGTSPYILTVATDTGKKHIEFDEKEYLLDSLTRGEIVFTAQDAQGTTQTDTLFINDVDNMNVGLKPIYYLDSEHVAIVPEQENPDLIYEWFFERSLISEENIFIAKKTGAYHLTIINTTGCKKEIPFRVENYSSMAQGSTPLDEKDAVPATISLKKNIKVYPNPVRNAQTFTVYVSLEEEKNVVIKIFDPQGKLYKYKELGEIKNYQYTNFIGIAGVYLITVTVGQEKITFREIVY